MKWIRSYYLYHSNKVRCCLKYQTQRTAFEEVDINWNDWDIRLGFLCSLLCVERLEESSGKLFLNILLHFCLQLRIIMPLAHNPQAAPWAVLYCCHHKTYEYQEEQKPTTMFWINMSSQHSISGKSALQKPLVYILRLTEGPFISEN